MDLVNERRREVGLGPVTGDGDQFRAPIYLYFTAPPLHPPEAELPSAWRALGPALWEPEFETPSWLDEIGNPIVFVAISSEYQRDDELVRTAFDSMRDEDVTVVVSTAAHDPDSFDVPANGRVARWLPHGAIVPRAACVVCHGGMGITQKALAAGVPVCVVPYERDQSAVAERVRSIGAGAVVARSDLSADALRAAVKDATAMGEGARRVADAFARIDGTRAAADELEALTERSVIGV
jgi:MGT family glycosyltransferase